MINRDLIRLAPQKAINDALVIDAGVLSSNPKLFVEQNVILYDIAINSWLLAVRDYAPYSWSSLLLRIRRTGLSSTVKYFTDAADLFIRSGELPVVDMESALASNLLKEIVAHFYIRSTHRVVYETTLTPEGVFVFLCRYLKRLTPLQSDLLDAKAIQDFKANQNRLKLIARRGYNPLIISLCRQEVAEFHKIWNSRCRKWSSILMRDIEITPGTCFALSGKKLSTLDAKYASLVDEYRYNELAVWRRSAWDFTLGETARLMTVPKSFKSARTIAPEELLRQAIAHRMFSLCDTYLPGIDLQDQEINQIYAKLGSQTGDWCTIDLSHASDDVSWVLVKEIFADYPGYIQYLSRIRSTYIVIDSKQSILQSFATMGNSMTFLNESDVFTIITRAAIKFANRMGENISEETHVYGDDIICQTDAYPYVVAFLEALGFMVNTTKSFADRGAFVFRESCGKDYLNGQDISSPYFPRRPLRNLLDWSRNRDGELITTGESLISLQHRLYEVSPDAAQYIEFFIRESEPTLGLVPVGTQTTDLWGIDTIPFRVKYLPEYVRVEQNRKSPWILTRAGWKYEPIRISYKKSVRQDDLHKVCYQKRPQVTVQAGSVDESILYNQYLAFGPYYQSDLDRLLGISTSRRTIPTGRATSTWKEVEF